MYCSRPTVNVLFRRNGTYCIVCTCMHTCIPTEDWTQHDVSVHGKHLKDAQVFFIVVSTIISTPSAAATATVSEPGLSRESFFVWSV